MLKVISNGYWQYSFDLNDSYMLATMLVVYDEPYLTDTAQTMMFSIKDFLSKCDQIRRKLRIWSHLLKKSLMENFSF